MKQFYTLLLLTFAFSGSSQIITEIMYNPPESGVDSLEFVEIYNNTGADIDLAGYQFVGISHVFEPRILAADSYICVAKNRSAFDGVYQASTIQWTNGSLNNTGEEISLLNPDSVKISTVRYENGMPWSENANGMGHSLELCSLTANESDPANWGFSTSDTGVLINDRTVFASPTRPNEADCSEVSEEYTSVAINEIMYDGPGDLDSLEYIELFNYGGDTVSLAGWSLDGDVVYNLPGLSLLPNRTLVLAKNDLAFQVAFNTVAFQWPDGQKLDDESGTVRLLTSIGTVVDEINYENIAPWPAISPGTAITLCDLLGDHSDPASWSAAGTPNDIPGIGILFGSPGSFNKCDAFSIGELTEIDGEGVLTMLGDTVSTTGIVHGPNFNPNGLQFTIIDEANDGIGIFTFDDTFGYEPAEGDNISVSGVLSQFNGLAQINPTSIVVNNTGNLLFEPTVVFRCSEETESQLIKLEGMHVVDPDDWTNTGSGFNVDITDGIDTVAMRIDADVVSIFGLEYPVGDFNVTGIGGQFDNSSPFDSGYQIFPRYIADIDPYEEFVEDTTTMVDLYPMRTIEEMTNSNADGLPDSLDIKCTLEGIVHGVNYSGSDLIMTIIDPDNNGIGIFNNDNTVGYVVQEGDIVRLQGTIGQFNGLTQLITDSLEILSIGNELVTPLDFNDVGFNFNEVDESSLIRIAIVDFADPSQWLGDGSSFNVDLISYSDPGELYTMRIDNDTEMASMPFPFSTQLLQITGLQGQFDSSSPFDSGYQILPRYFDDFINVLNTFDTDFDSEIQIYPNPTKDQIFVKTENEIELYKIFNTLGQLVKSDSFENVISISDLPEGSYSILFKNGEKLSNKKFMVIK